MEKNNKITLAVMLAALLAISLSSTAGAAPATLVAVQPPAKGCGCGILNVSNYLCNVTRDLSTNGTCFGVRANNVTIQCNGHQISGINGSLTLGIVSGYVNATVVENCRLNQITSGISFAQVHGGRIENITAKSDALGTSILLASSSHNVVSGIRAYSVGTGLDLDGSDYNNLTTIYLESSYDKPLLLLNSGNNRLSNVSGTTTHNQAGVFITPITLQHSDNNTLESCKGSAYGEGGNGAPGIVLQGSSSNVISNTFGVSPGDVGFVLESGSNGNKLINCSAPGWMGFEVKYSNDNTLDGCSSNGIAGAWIFGSNYTTIKSSRFSASGDAFALTDAKNSMVANNTFNSTCGTALDLLSMFGSCTGNQFVNNTLISSGGLLDLNAGLQLPGLQSTNNTFYWNNFTATAGFYIKDIGSGNHYGAVINGKEEGNIYANVLNGSVRVLGNKPSSGFPALFIGTNGTGFPYSSATAQGKIIGNAVDNAPLTPFSQAYLYANRFQMPQYMPSAFAPAHPETHAPGPAAIVADGMEK